MRRLGMLAFAAFLILKLSSAAARETPVGLASAGADPTPAASPLLAPRPGAIDARDTGGTGAATVAAACD